MCHVSALPAANKQTGATHSAFSTDHATGRMGAYHKEGTLLSLPSVLGEKLAGGLAAAFVSHGVPFGAVQGTARSEAVNVVGWERQWAKRVQCRAASAIRAWRLSVISVRFE